MEFRELVAEAADEEIVAFGARDRPRRVNGGLAGEAFGQCADGYVAEYPGDEPVTQQLEFVPVGGDLGVDG